MGWEWVRMYATNMQLPILLLYSDVCEGSRLLHEKIEYMMHHYIERSVVILYKPFSWWDSECDGMFEATHSLTSNKPITHMTSDVFPFLSFLFVLLKFIGFIDIGGSTGGFSLHLSRGGGVTSRKFRGLKTFIFPITLLPPLLYYAGAAHARCWGSRGCRNTGALWSFL